MEVRNKEEFVEKIFKIGIIKFGEFILSSGMKSSFYIDLRPLPSYPSLFKFVTIGLKKLIENELQRNVGIATIELSGIPLATSLAYEVGKPLVYLRKKQKEHGTKSLIEGDLSTAEEFIAVDDVLTTGSSLLQIVETLRNNGKKVSLALVVFDRLQGGKEALEKSKVELRRLFDIEETAEILRKRGLIKEEEYRKLMQR